MEITKGTVINAITNNDTKTVLRIFEEFDLKKDNRPIITSAHKECISDICSQASAMSYRCDLSGKLTEEIIDHVSVAINLFDLLPLVITAEKIKNDDFESIPENIRVALKENKYTPKIAQDIESLSTYAFNALLVFIKEKIENLDVLFTRHIIRSMYMYDKDFIFTELLFAYMAICIRKPVDDILCRNFINGLIITCEDIDKEDDEEEDEDDGDDEDDDDEDEEDEKDTEQ